MIIQFSANPYTSESQLLGTACATALATAAYFPSTGLAANRALISVSAGDTRFKLNSSAPATACGHIFADGNYVILDDVAQMQKFRIFCMGATASAYMHVTYFMG